MNSSPKLLQLNVTANWGSTGKIAEDIGNLAIKNGFQSWIAYGRETAVSNSELIKVGDKLDIALHGIQSKFLDRHGLASKKSTKKFIDRIKEIKPDIIHLHNFHGYFINYPILFNFLKNWDGPVVWTLHDCWPFTGHCAYYSYAQCNRWQTGCFKCPQLSSYPSSLYIDRSLQNYTTKKDAFLGLNRLTIVPVSQWLSDQVSLSFLKDYPRKVIYNGIDLETFNIKENSKKTNSKKILGVANVWSDRKGLSDFIKLRELLPSEYKITLVGLSRAQIKSIPNGITGIERTENIHQLVNLYNQADVYVNTSVEETLGMTTIEALACGTPSVVYNATAIPETIDSKTGIVVPPKDISKLSEAIKYICDSIPFTASDCRSRAKTLFDKNKTCQSYIDIYNSLLK